jgi:hypothetical protein
MPNVWVECQSGPLAFLEREVKIGGGGGRIFFKLPSIALFLPHSFPDLFILSYVVYA